MSEHPVATMKKLLHVDAGTCGGESLPDEVDPEGSCEIEPGKVAGREIVSVTDPGEPAALRAPAAGGRGSNA